MPSLGKDLATVRNKKGLSLEDVQKITKVPPAILRSIEDDSIFAQINQNTTYIRSYVRSYAKAVGIKESEIVQALNKVEAGNYDGSLAKTSSIDKSPESEQRSADTPQKSDMIHDHSPEFSSQKKEKAPPSSKKTGRKKEHPTAALSSADWVDVGLKANKVQSKSRVWSGLLIIILIVAALAAIFLVYNYYNSEPANQNSIQESGNTFEADVPSDSLRESLITEGNQPATVDTAPGEQGILGDTLSIAIYAANGKLEPVRIYTDLLGNQNPYWVTQGDTIVFNFVNTVRVRAVNQYDRMQLLFNGHLIQNYYEEYYNAESGMVELDRSIFEDDPKWRTPAN